ncbi:NADH-quinone oxidoreductase subunit L [Acidimicrobiaceae bacterium]|nr:NADH-quinone oxidoreductase subunit L [Acidimicrobiaceae bacterium]
MVNFTSTIFAEGELIYTDGGLLAQYAWLLVLMPFVAALIITFMGKYLPLKGAEVALATIGLIFLYSSALMYSHITSGVVNEFFINVGSIGVFDIEFGWVVDGLSIMMYFVVGTVALLVFIYATNYMEGEIRYTFFFTSLTLFAGSMLVLVSSPTLIQILIGWELVGVCSYLLIGHYWEKKDNSSAAMKAFITNKIADVGLMIGIIILALNTGTLRISEILYQATHEYEKLSSVAFIAAILLFIGAMGKSAQFPLHVWLPDAMAGPTPVSALMHAATMVTAGVYLLARMFPFYKSMAPEALDIVMLFGVITLLAAGLIAVVQDDLKKVLAYSTVSQLGYMVAAIGSGAYTAALFHLWTHAFFKALLFLGAGSVIHAVHSNSMLEMGGLRKVMPKTFATFIIGTVALAGLPPFAGFFSKDEILASFNHEGEITFFFIAVLGAFITAFYMTRAVSLTFLGEYRGHGHPHESHNLMTTPLLALSVFAIASGWVNIPGVYTGFTDWVTTRKNKIVEYHPESFDLFALSSGLLAGLLGIALGYYLYQLQGSAETGDDKIKIQPIWSVLENKYYLDDFYFKYVIDPVKINISRAVDKFNTNVIDRFVNGFGQIASLLGGIVYNNFDQNGIDKLLNMSSSGTDSFGGKVKLLQTGKTQQYLMLFLGGVVTISLLILFII